MVAGAGAGFEPRRPVRALGCIGGGKHEGRPRRVNLGGRGRPAALALREPRAREVAVLARLGLVEDGAVACGHERLGALVVARERDLGHEEARLERSPRILEAFVDLEGDAGVCLGGVVLVGVEGDHREQALARRLAARVLHLAKAGSRGEGARSCAREVEAPVVGVPERHVALRDAEAIADAIELGARLREEVAPALEAARPPLRSARAR